MRPHPIALVLTALLGATTLTPCADPAEKISEDRAAPRPRDAAPATARTSTRAATRPGPEPTWLDTDRCPEPCPPHTECVTETPAEGVQRAACRARCTTTADCPKPEVCGAPTVAAGHCTNDRWRDLLELDCIHPATAEPHTHP